MNVEIYNPDNLPDEFIRAEIAQAEKEKNRKRIRRITGYLVGTIDRWNDAKRAEEKDRVKHAC